MKKKDVIFKRSKITDRNLRNIVKDEDAEIKITNSILEYYKICKETLENRWVQPLLSDKEKSKCEWFLPIHSLQEQRMKR